MRSATLLSACVILFAFAPIPAFGQGAPEKISFQGYLTDTLGDPLDSTDVGIVFNLYKGGSSVWFETQTVDVNDGVFNVRLGAVKALDTVAFNQPIDLGIKLSGAGAEMTPRTPLASSAFALGVRGLYVFDATDGDFSAPNLVGGAANNEVAEDVVGATISGGGGTSVGSPVPNSVLARWGTVGGGLDNTAGWNYSTVGGGHGNTAGGEWSTIGGGQSNAVSAGAQHGTIGGGLGNDAAGGWGTTIGGGNANTVSENYATVGGGQGNTASDGRATVGGGGNNTAAGAFSTVAGGSDNMAIKTRSTVGGGQTNTASGNYATVPGGRGNTAGGYTSFATGHLALAKHDGAFVWQDSSGTTTDSLSSTASNQFLARASGGFSFLSAPAPDTDEGVFVDQGSLRLRKDGQSVISFSRPGSTTWTLGPQASQDGFVLYANGAAGSVITVARATGNVGFGTAPTANPIQMASGAHVTAGGVWTDASSKTLKEDFQSVDATDVLERVADLPIRSWRYKKEPDAVHMGPVAEDFYASFALGADDKHIAALDGNGVALAAIQGLYDLVKEQQAAIGQLQSENAQMRAAMKRAGME